MDSAGEIKVSDASQIKWLPLAAAVVALVGLVDSIYLTIHHYQKTVVPCSLVSGCETVLTSQYAEIAGVPLALFGALAYFAVFSLATLAAFGSENSWKILSIAVALMAIFTAWLLYLQAFVIGAFCQFCLLSAATTFALLAIVAARYFVRRRKLS